MSELDYKKEVIWRVYHGTSRGGEYLPVTFEQDVAKVNLEPSIYRTSPLVMSAECLRNMADLLDKVQEAYLLDKEKVRLFQAAMIEAGE